MSSASWPAARAFHSPSRVMRYVWMCSGARSSSAKIASSWRALSASGWATSSSTVRSLCTMRGPSAIGIESTGRSPVRSASCDGFRPGGRSTMLDTGSVRSMSAARSRPRRRPPPRPVASRVNERSVPSGSRTTTSMIDRDRTACSSSRPSHAASESVACVSRSRAMSGANECRASARVRRSRRAGAARRQRLAAVVDRDDRVPGVGERPVHDVARGARHERIPVADEAERTQRLIDGDRAQDARFGALDHRVAVGARAHADESVAGGGARDEVLEGLRDAGERERRAGTRASTPPSRPRSCRRRATRR